MESVYEFVVRPKGERYNNTTKVEDRELILNTEVFNHQYVNREAEVIGVPRMFETNIEVGDTVIIHHNVFRRWHDMKGRERNSKSYFDDDTYIIGGDQIYLCKKPTGEIVPPTGFCFVQPVKATDQYNIDKEKPLVGVMKHADSVLKSSGITNGDLIGFTPGDEYEFVIDGERLYRIYSKFITIKYGHQGKEETYNPSWAKSS